MLRYHFEKFVTARITKARSSSNQERHALVIENSDVVNGLWQHLLNDYAITEIFGFNRDVTRQRLANSPTCATMQRQQPKDGQPSVIPVHCEPKGKFDQNCRRVLDHQPRRARRNRMASKR